MRPNQKCVTAKWRTRATRNTKKTTAKTRRRGGHHRYHLRPVVQNKNGIYYIQKYMHHTIGGSVLFVFQEKHIYYTLDYTLHTTAKYTCVYKIEIDYSWCNIWSRYERRHMTRHDTQRKTDWPPRWDRLWSSDGVGYWRQASDDWFWTHWKYTETPQGYI